MFKSCYEIIDIGGGLRALKTAGNRYDPENEYLRPFIEKKSYKILDPVPDYNPDIVGDIQNLPFDNNSVEAIICIAVLEHVENPILAFSEMYRVLKPGGKLFVSVPFLYYYHAEKGYYGDYWRFTEDSLKMMTKHFSKVQIMPVRGAIETWFRISPLGRYKLLQNFGYMLDILTGKINTKQVSSYCVYAEK